MFPLITLVHQQQYGNYFCPLLISKMYFELVGIQGAKEDFIISPKETKRVVNFHRK